MAIKKLLYAALNLETGEVRSVGLLTGFYAALVMAFIFLLSASLGMFISEFGSKYLPYAYLSIAALGALVAYIYFRLSERINLEKLVVYNLAFILVIFVVYRIGLASPLRRTVIFLLPLLYQTMINLANLAVWPLAGSAFDLRQAKRLFGIIGIGNWIANILGGVVVAPIVDQIGLPNLLYISMGWVLIAGLVLKFVLADRKSKQPPAPRMRTRIPLKRIQQEASPLRNAYVRRILAYVMLWWISFFFIDIIFFERAAIVFPEGADLAGLVGQLRFVTGIFALITTTFITSRILKRYGLRAGLLAMPAGVTLLLFITAMLGTLLPESPWIFYVAALTKMVNLGLGFSLSQTALTLLYQPLPGIERTRVQTLAEGIYQPIAIGISGLFLLLFNTLLRIDAIGLSFIFLALAAGWILSIASLTQSYPQALADALAKRRLGEDAPDFSDSESRAILVKSLKDPDHRVVNYALRVLESQNPNQFKEDLPGFLPFLLEHESIHVRIAALGAVDRLKIDAGSLIEARFGAAENVDEKAALILVLKHSRSAFHKDLVVQTIKQPDITLKQAALTAILQIDDANPEALATLSELTLAPTPSDRIHAARVIEALPTGTVVPLLQQLLEDADPNVRRAAVLAAPGKSDKRIWEAVVETANHPETARTTIRILAEGGLDAQTALSAKLKQPDLTPRMFRTLICAAGRNGGRWSNEALEPFITYFEPHARSIIWEALRENSYKTQVNSEMNSIFLSEISAAAVVVQGIFLFERNGQSLLFDALSEELRVIRTRVLDFLSFITPNNRLGSAREALLESQSPELVYALEILETQVPADIKPLVLPLFDSVSWQERLISWDKSGIRAPGTDAKKWLLTVLENHTALKPTHWTRACLYYTAGQLELHECRDAAVADYKSAEVVVRDMAAWAFSRLIKDAPDQGVPMLSTIEKMLILKSTDIFHRIPDHILGEISTLVEEMEVDEGVTVFQEGDFGDSLFILVEGEVVVIDEGQPINVLGARDTFGEMALLDPEPRSATVVASMPTKLLRLDQLAFSELLYESPEFAQGIIRSLTDRLRTATKRISQL